MFKSFWLNCFLTRLPTALTLYINTVGAESSQSDRSGQVRLCQTHDNAREAFSAWKTSLCSVCENEASDQSIWSEVLWKGYANYYLTHCRWLVDGPLSETNQILLWQEINKLTASLSGATTKVDRCYLKKTKVSKHSPRRWYKHYFITC